MDERAPCGSDLERQHLIERLEVAALVQDVDSQSDTGTYSSEHPSRRSADAPQPGEPSQPGTIQQLNLGFQATWEIDIWGKYRRNAEAAKAALQGAHAGYELALVTLSADVAQQYFSYRMT